MPADTKKKKKGKDEEDGKKDKDDDDEDDDDVYDEEEEKVIKMKADSVSPCSPAPDQTICPIYYMTCPPAAVHQHLAPAPIPQATDRVPGS
jgi:hypothetical protein